MCWYMPGMSHTKAVVVVPSCSIIIHPETLMKTKSLLWECDPVILGMTVSSPSGSMEFIPATKLMYIPKSLPRIRLCRKRLSWIMEDAPLLGLPESILGDTRQCWDDLPQPDAAFWNEVPQPPPAQLNPPASFFLGWGAFPRLVPLRASPTAGTFSQKFPTSFHVPGIKQWLYECGLGDLADEFGRQIPASVRHWGLIFLSREAGGIWRKQPSLIGLFGIIYNGRNERGGRVRIGCSFCVKNSRN